MNITLLPTTAVSQKCQVQCESSVPNQYTLIDKNTDRIHQLNITASMIWDLCKTSITIDDISSKIIEEYDVEKQQAYNDVCNVVLHLNELGVLNVK